MDEGFLKKKDNIMDIALEIIACVFFTLFMVATLFDLITQLFPGLTAKQADMQDRVERVQDAIKEYNNSKEPKK